MIAMNSGNLVPQNKRTKKEQREIARKGGIKSGEARRKKKLMKDQISLLLSLPFPDVRDKTGKKIRTMFKQLGIDDENIDNQIKELKVEKKEKSNADNILKKYKHIKELNKTILDEFIDKVYIGEYDKETKTRDIEIEWNFEF